MESYQATMYYDPNDISKSSCTIRISSESFLTAHEKRDAELKGEHFLDAENFPAIWFQGEEVAETETGFDFKRGIEHQGYCKTNNHTSRKTYHDEKGYE